VVTDAVHTGPVGAITYLAEVADNPAFANKITVTAPEGSGQTTLTVSQALAYGTVYYWHVLASDPTTIGPFSATSSFTTPAAPVVVAPTPPSSGGGSSGPGLNMSGAVILGSPSDLANWPQTSTITSVQFNGGGPFPVDFDKRTGTNRWPDVPFGSGSLQYTLGMCVNPGGAGQWYCSAVVQFWYGRELTASGDAGAIGSEWFYDPGRWGPIVGYQPQVGETVGLFVAAGNLRGTTYTQATCPMVCERSNVALVSWEVGIQNAVSSALRRIRR
jgi:hypothetical protein